MTIHCFIDGCARPNPGRGGMGIVIRGNDWDYALSVGIPGRVSNNQAEYSALVHSLEELLRNQCQDKLITIFSDSLMLVEQMNGNRKVDRGGAYVDKYLEAQSLLNNFSDLMFVWIDRGQNAEANMLASKGLKH